MALATTSTGITNSIRTQYIAKYLETIAWQRVYDQIAVPYTAFSDGLSMDELMSGSSIQINFLSGMQPGTTAISELTDVTPQLLRDATASVTPTSRGEALQWSENLDIQVYTDYADKRLGRIGENSVESIDLLAQAVATKGSWVERATARASLDAGTASHRGSDSIFRKYHAKMMSLKVPGFVNEDGSANTWAAIMHPYVFHDISESGNVDNIGTYQQAGIHLNFEIGQVGPFRLVASPWAKVFGAAGADNATNVADTLASAANRLATTITTSSDVSSSASNGEFWWIGTEETANTHYATNEPVKVLSASGTTVTVMGQGPNGGLRYDHDAAVAVRNADSVYTIVFGGPQSLVKVFATDVGEYGQVVGPKMQGLLDQFASIGWKFYGQYGRIAENRILRHECSTSYEA